MRTLLTAFLCLFAAFPAAAHEFEVGELEIVHPVALVTSNESSEAIGYMRIHNASDENDRLLSVSAPEISDVIELTLQEPDEVGINKGVLTALDIPARQETTLTPTGNHITFSKLKQPLMQDSSFPAVLKFEKAGDVTVIFNVERSADHHAH